MRIHHSCKRSSQTKAETLWARHTGGSPNRLSSGLLQNQRVLTKTGTWDLYLGPIQFSDQSCTLSPNGRRGKGNRGYASRSGRVDVATLPTEDESSYTHFAISILFFMHVVWGRLRKESLCTTILQATCHGFSSEQKCHPEDLHGNGNGNGNACVCVQGPRQCLRSIVPTGTRVPVTYTLRLVPRSQRAVQLYFNGVPFKSVGFKFTNARDPRAYWD
ncbi:hypothetical protein DUNSADRAFT_11725 [Dunaliella salina]|uniref:Uncharacterized protein n=1 Tax=Dunaliella salina TaxID=3046 RepID=A0ABQ7GCV9_DUNSA|nr:hypothetical protein DUNSADRAFT_11725 [Dunaliella salina]|eukprot:KAF5832393.1 hypothetical protein DUNSADRAFT_11725 [Dunaliella salina]